MKYTHGARSRGLTLVEALVSLAILGIIASVALPTMQHMRDTTRLKGLAQQVMTDLRYAQNESRKRKTTVTFNVRSGDGTWCYGLNEHTACDCNTPNDCTLDGEEKVVSSTSHPGLDVLPGVTNSRFNFRPQRLTVTAGHVKVQGAGREIRIVVSGYGRIRECTPSGSSRVSPLPVCT